MSVNCHREQPLHVPDGSNANTNTTFIQNTFVMCSAITQSLINRSYSDRRHENKNAVRCLLKAAFECGSYSSSVGHPCRGVQHGKRSLILLFMRLSCSCLTVAEMSGPGRDVRGWPRQRQSSKRVI